MSDAALGFIGLGQMGAPMAARLGGAGHALTVYDAAERRHQAPANALVVASAADVAAACPVVFLCLPDGQAVEQVCDALATAATRATTTVVDLSTIGIEAAKRAHGRLAQHDIDYLDAPVSGGPAGAKAGTLAMMVAGETRTVGWLRPALETMAENCFHVGTRVGQGQAMKLLNNFLSSTALVATSEAIAFGEDHGLNLGLMLDVLNVSSGCNTATSDKFPRWVLSGTFEGGSTTNIHAKDMQLYADSVATTGADSEVGGIVGRVWSEAAAALPGRDGTRIYEFVRARRRQSR